MNSTPECDFEANFAHALVQHMRSEGHVSVTTVSCPQCEEDWPFEELPSHYESCVQSLIRTNPSPPSSSSSSRGVVFLGKVYPRRCEFCDYIANSYGAYNAHLTRRHFKAKFKCLHCKGSYTNDVRTKKRKHDEGLM